MKIISFISIFLGIGVLPLFNLKGQSLCVVCQKRKALESELKFYYQLAQHETTLKSDLQKRINYIRTKLHRYHIIAQRVHHENS